MKKNKTSRWAVLVLAFLLLATGVTTPVSAGVRDAYSYYEDYGNEVYFFPVSKTDGMIYYATKANLATSATRYRTIGWKLSVESLSGDRLQTLYFKLDGSYMKRLHDCRKSGTEYNLYVLSLMDLKGRLNAKASQAMNKGNATMRLDACMIVVKNGRAKGAMNDSGPTSGSVYTTYAGIAGAESWSSASYQSFYSYFGKEIHGLFFPVEAEAGTGIASIEGSGMYCYGSQAVLQAKVQKGYAFDVWMGDCHGTEVEQAFVVNNYVKCVAYGKKKQLQIIFHRNAQEGDTVTELQDIEYGDGKVALKNIPWKVKGKKQTGWALTEDAKTVTFSCRQKLTDRAVIRYSPKLHLYAVWKDKEGEKTQNPQPEESKPEEEKPEEPKNETPKPDRPKQEEETSGEPKDKEPSPTEPDPAHPIPDDPVRGDGGEEDTRGKILSFHCRFISSNYFEDAGGNLIPKEQGGLAADSKWVQEESLRMWLRQLLQ